MLKQLNTLYDYPARGSWSESWPDLEEPITRQVVEVALTDLKKAWGQCLYYYRMGASRIHLVLSPKLFLDYKNNESAFVRENPIPNVDVYTLPQILVRVSHKVKVKPKRKPVKSPMLKFIITDEEKENMSKTFGYEGYHTIDLDADIDDPSMTETLELAETPTKDGKYCFDCPEFANEGVKGVCKKFNWAIVLELAKRDAVCME
jgi:hypothetical protein